jgi:hypothetical protein
MNNTRARLGEWAMVMATGLFVAVPALAAERSENGTLSIVLENDWFSSKDQHYTNGLQAAWTPAGKPVPAWALRFVRLLPWFPAAGEVRHGYAFGQNIYTANDISLVDPPPEEPPYAGWLYGSIGMNVWTGRQSDLFALTLGVVGPASLAEPSQKFIHKITGSDKPRGWDTQLENEPGIVLTYQRSWRGQATEAPGGLKLDLTPHVGAALGNVYTYANAGLTLRYGRRLPQDDGPLRIQPGAPGSGFYVAGDDFGWYVFAGLDGRAVARNIFLDGNTFRDSRSIDKEPFVGDLQLGFALTWRSARLSYAHVLRTREYTGQPRNEDFGALSLSMPL